MRELELSEHRAGGIVFLVGAGPGDPGLLTVKGARLLERADAVVYDALVDTRVLAYCPDAQLVFVGKRAAAHSFTQEQINRTLVELAGEGKRVVRLKGGDPFVFGRGGEECEALHEAGIPFEVVPGITAAIAAPAYAGIPVTHRDFNSSFTLITGHEKESAYQDPQSLEREPGAGASDVDWASIAKLPCLAFYMGVKSLPRICAKLIEHGMSADTPAACIRYGTRPSQQTVTGTLATLPQRAAEANIAPPALSIVGKVVSLRPALNWFESRPLFGQTIVVTRTRQQASALSQRLEDLGAGVIEAPTIELAPPANWSIVDGALRSIPTFDWVIFTSATGVSYTKRRLLEIGLDGRAFASTNIAAIGEATAAAVREALCLKVDLCPANFVAEALADGMEAGGEVKGKRHLLLRAEIARPVLRERLQRGGSIEVRDVAVYETRAARSLPPALMEALDVGTVTWITFTSSSTVKNFIELLGADYERRLAGVKTASIGPITSATLEELGLKPTVQARTFDIDGLVTAIALSS
jgi:uroporphyrinogen III methyltransferase/synthase